MAIKSKLHYFFVWGRHPALACAEVLTALGRWNIKAALVDASVESGIVEVDQYLPEEFIDQLGGTIKLGLVVDSISSKEPKENFKKLLATAIAEKISHEQSRKIVFGISQYRSHNLVKPLSEKVFTSLGMEVKNILKKHHTVRWVTSRESNLSSVVVKKNKLIEKGGEVVLLHTQKEMHIGRTTAIQPFEEYSVRDYGRLETDTFSGMIPPKLAHIMLNISQVSPNEIVVDPFCGSGTILQEALVMG